MGISNGTTKKMELQIAVRRLGNALCFGTQHSQTDSDRGSVLDVVVRLFSHLHSRRGFLKVFRSEWMVFMN